MDSLLNRQDLHYKTGFHGKPLIIAWLPLVNFAVLFASIKWCKYTFYYHLILALGVIILTLLSTVHILVDDWLSPNQNFKIQKVHNIAGLAVTIWLGVQIITGILAKIIQYMPNIKTNTCILIKRVHYISSYLLMLVSKFNYLNIKFMKGKYLEFAQYFILQILFLAVYLWIKSSYWTLSEEIVDGQLSSKVETNSRNKIIYFIMWLKEKIISIKQEITQKSFKIPKIKINLIKYKSQKQVQLQKYITFNDIVYDISKLKYRHPGGQHIINMINKRQVNRFLYGYYKLQNDHKLTIHKHSKESLRLCGQPVGMIQRSLPIQGFDLIMKFKLSSIQPINENSQVHHIMLKPLTKQRYQTVNMTFKGYKQQSQLGQHLSLTICNQKGRKRCTRLYTTVWCMRPSNIEFMKRYFPLLNQNKKEKVKYKEYQQNSLIESLIQSQTNYSDKEFNTELIPLVMKKYDKGTFTSRLIVDDFNGEIIASQPMGMGMKYHQLQDNGKVILVCGGTGILPFIDFIDLLFKRVLVFQQNINSQIIKINDSIVNQDLIKSRQFILYYAVQDSADIIPMTLYQLDYLNKSKHIKFEVNLKIKRNINQMVQNFNYFKYQTHGFKEQIKSHLNSMINKIYVCGPYKMNQEMHKIFEQHHLHQDFYQFM